MRARAWLFLWLLAPAALLPCAAASAQTCTVAVTPVNFGTYSPFDTTPLTSTGQVRVNCEGSGGYSVALNAGANSGGSFAGRSLGNGQSKLSYQLYSDPARTQIWGDGSGGSAAVPISGSGTLTIYGRIPARQSVSAGAYGDTILVTIAY